MNFGYFLVVFVAVNSTCNCGVVKPTANVNSTSSGHRLSVPWQIRFATMSVTCLFLSTSIWLTTAPYLDTERLTRFGRIAVITLLTVVITIGYVGFGWFIPFEITFLTKSSSKEVWLLVMQQWDFYILISFAIIVRLWPPNITFINLDVTDLSAHFRVVYITLNLLLPILIILGVYKQLFSGLNPLAILLVVSYIGAVLIASRVGQLLCLTASINLMLFVNIQLLTTLNSALNEGKSIWPLTVALIFAILIIFAIRSISIELIRRGTGNQDVLESYIFRQLQLALQLSLSCLLCYFTCLIYSFSAQ